MAGERKKDEVAMPAHPLEVEPAVARSQAPAADSDLANHVHAEYKDLRLPPKEGAPAWPGSHLRRISPHISG